MTRRRLLGPPLAILLFALPARGVEPRVAAEVRERFAEGATEVPVLVALRTPGAPLPEGEGVNARRLLPGGAAAVVTRAGLELLARDARVAAVALDGVVHPSGQAGTAQIGADRLLALGLDGSGRSVAVVDTGIDATSPDMGGGPVPNGKVVAGWNAADGSGDVSDCAGHGTEVAGVVAGPQGVAPGARLVALKVFGESSGCSAALYSDVLAAVSWAVAHRDDYHIEAINMSLSGDAWRAGFCDTDDPVSAAVFRSAREAGVGVIAASGNEGRVDGIAWPGCFSDVTAVGMVYSGSVGPFSWEGAASCQDRITGADIVPCASNSGAALGLLAPGVRWVTTMPGGAQTQGFSGTSAAAPAATGAFLLARQARATADPLLLVDQLRATGVPVVDDKSARATARVDLGAALDATSPVTGPCDAAAIPDGVSQQLTCTALVSSLAGTVSSLSVALSIDHPDPTQLVVTLTGPDGTSVVLMNRSGRRGHPVREVFGRTAAPLEPLSSFAGRAAAGTWKLSVLDTVPGDAGRLVSWALQIEPEAPAVATGPPARTRVVPTAVHAAGRFGAFFTTEVRLFNGTAQEQRITLRLRPSSGASATAEPDRAVSATLPPWGTRVLSDVVGDTFRTSDFGPLYVDAPAGVVVGSRTSASAPGGGRYGLFVPSVAAGAGISAVTPPLTLIPATRAGNFRVNVGLTEMEGAPATVEVTIRDGHGAPKGSVTANVAPFAIAQVNDLYAATAALPSDDDRIDVRVAAGAGRVVPWATAIDNRTNDGTFVGGSAAAADILLPAVANAAGLFGALFRTDVKLANPGPTPVRVRVTYFPSLGSDAVPVVVPLGVGETRLVKDVLGTLFSLPSPAAGAIRLASLEGSRFLATSRTYADSPDGTFGLSCDPSVAGDEAMPGQSLALTFLSGGTARTNVGFVETSGVPTAARVSLHGADGALLATRDLSLDASAAVQWNDVFATMGVEGASDASAVVQVLSGGRLAGYAITIDDRTNDAGLVPATLLP